ncbi:antibiotic biosynthesis monooxygenase family protein [Lentzea sp. NPDC051838]|uniref:antibiotic biosynthesis monooxygenase family protein n=1 Tax=Lentzea sp. NPDC051838 TaxID=3154849 RepID=UPI0034417ABE
MITFVNRFTLTGDPEEFEKAFDETAGFLREQPGLIKYTLSRQLDDPASYINIALWETADALRAALAHPEFPNHAKAMRGLAESSGALFTPRLSFEA